MYVVQLDVAEFLNQNVAVLVRGKHWNDIVALYVG